MENIKEENTDKSSEENESYKPLGYKDTIINYYPLVKSLAFKYSKKNSELPLEMEDYENVQLMKLKSLVNDFDPSRGKYFPVYIKDGLIYHLNNLVRNYKTNGHTILNSFVEFKDINKGDSDPSVNLIKSENYNEKKEKFQKIVSSKLSQSERKVINLYIENHSVKQIAEKLNWELKKVYSTKSRAIEKIREFFNKVNV